MNRDDIIRLAREAGVTDLPDSATWHPLAISLLQFAELIAAAEREACAKFVENQCAKWQLADLYELREVADAIRARKNER